MKINSIPKQDGYYLEPVANEIIWFTARNRREVNLEIEKLKSYGFETLRIGIDCAEFNTKKGSKWYDWLIPTLAQSFELELCFDNFSKTDGMSICPKQALPEIVEHFILKHGKYFSVVELWRNPSDRKKQDSVENIFSDDVVFTTTWAKYLGKKVKLGKIRPIDFEWITKLISSQFLKNIECLEIDKEEGNLWETNTKFYERTLRSLFHAKGVSAEIFPNENSTTLNQLSKGIA
ncbi:hypothetical protein [uncultured Algoriphagus sp.]|uniref:hypothetical protein n=1 Tax=uncultured Algoriphagus sp. TaxID=417365 RepID=UPI0030ED6106|tara:strand:+ start:12483 stop:13184 length:702 start_codon:yes stop_codon:yes gene_type:complete